MNPLPGQKTVVCGTLGDEIVGYENENDFRPGDGEGGGGGGGGKSRTLVRLFFLMRLYTPVIAGVCRAYLRCRYMYSKQLQVSCCTVY